MAGTAMGGGQAHPLRKAGRWPAEEETNNSVPHIVSRTLGDICDEVQGTIRTGPFGSQLHESDYCQEGHPVVMPKNILDGRVSTDEIAHIGDEDADRLNQHQLKKGDIVYGRRGDIGRRALITQREAGWHCGTGCLRISLGDSILDPQFLYYFLGQPNVTGWIYNQAVGATMANLNTSIIRSVRVSYPPLPTQRKIAAILSAYDDLIENNTRRIKILEEMAQALYREWFVHFRFPGHERTRIAHGTPEGWKTLPLKALCVNGNGIQTGPFGSQLHQSDYTEEGVPVVMPQDLIGFRVRVDHIARIPEGVAEKLRRHRVRPGDILYGRRGDIGRRAYVLKRQDGWLCGTGCLRIRPEPSIIQPGYLFDALGREETAATIAGRAKGATMPNLNTQIMTDIPILTPPSAVQEQYVDYVEPTFELVELLAEGNRKLKATRDLLLPKLISGEIDVSNLDTRT